MGGVKRGQIGSNRGQMTPFGPVLGPLFRPLFRVIWAWVGLLYRCREERTSIEGRTRKRLNKGPRMCQKRSILTISGRKTGFSGFSWFSWFSGFRVFSDECCVLRVNYVLFMS